MSGGWFHLAQVNIARAKAPLGDPLLADFVSRIEEVNAAAEAAPGFVWRYRDDAESPTAADPRLLFNMSVWESPEALASYVRSPRHMEVMRRRAEWFERIAGPSLALWWTPAGERPRPREAMERLSFLEAHGGTAAAFGFRDAESAPDAPASVGVEGEVRYDGRRFAPVESSSNGDVEGSTIFEYRQQGGRVWARYSGPKVLFGALVAGSNAAGELDMRYRHFTPSGELRAGRCSSTPEGLPDGRLRLHEEWEWTTGDCSSGRSVLEELA